MVTGSAPRASAICASVRPSSDRIRRVEGDLDRGGAAAAPEVLPGHGLDRLHLLGIARRGEGDSARQQGRAQAGGRGIVGVLIREHLDAARAGLVDPADEREREAPVVRPQRLHVADDADDVRLVGDADHLLHGGDDTDVVVRLVADVAGIEPAERSGDLGQGDHFPRGRVAAGNVEEPAREAERPLLHGAPDEPAHAIEFLGSRRAVRVAHDGAPDGAVSHEQGHVRSETARFEVAALRREIHRATAVGVAHDRRDALRQQRLPLLQLRPREPFLRIGGMRVNVDEPGCDQQVTRLDRPRGGGRAERSDRRDPPIPDADVSPDPGIARPVHDTSVANQDIERDRRLRRLSRLERRNRCGRDNERKNGA